MRLPDDDDTTRCSRQKQPNVNLSLLSFYVLWLLFMYLTSVFTHRNMVFFLCIKFLSFTLQNDEQFDRKKADLLFHSSAESVNLSLRSLRV